MKIFLLFLALILSIFVFPIGFVFNVFTFRKKKWFFYSALKMTYEVLLVFYDLFLILAVLIDRLGNVIGGNMFITLFILNDKKNETLFGKNECTISASLGKAVLKKQLNKEGINFVWFLELFAGERHCIEAYQWYLIKKNFNKKIL